MDVPPALVQFLGSLAAILVLAGIAWMLGLGKERGIASEEEARLAAQEAFHGFIPVEIALDRAGRAALLRDADGQILLLRPHGTHVAGRILTPASSARVEDGRLVIDSGERRFGRFTIGVDDAQAWACRIEAV